MFAKIVAKAKALWLQFDAIWRSDQSTVAGFISMATGFFTGEYAHALHVLGIAEDVISKIGAALVLVGAFFVTPRLKK